MHIPGTQSWQARPGANPFDLSADAAALAGRPNAVGAVVARGLRSCGARPGEPVLLSGHSLGGIAAAELAADQVLRREFTITHVVSAGSPTALSDVPDDVSVLSLEHDQDPVPWLDGEPSPDRANWVTVRRPVDGALHAHDTQEYARTGAMVDASADGSLAAAASRPGPIPGPAGGHRDQLGGHRAETAVNDATGRGCRVACLTAATRWQAARPD